MQKEFNITGTCFPSMHYMMDNRRQMQDILNLIAFGKYFTINRPRQFGKTTTLSFLADHFEESQEYQQIRLDFQGVDSQNYTSDRAFARMFINQLINFFKIRNKAVSTFLKSEMEKIEEMDDLSVLITQLVQLVKQKIVLLIDEVDASTNYEPFLKFLAMLRAKYLHRMERGSETFHSIVLFGVHDIKNLKFKLRNPDDAQYNSPWNIAVDFEVQMEFFPNEIVPMLEQYSAAEGIEMDTKAIAERLYYHTSGYPFLVSKLCKNIAEKILPKTQKKNWTLEDVEESVQIVLLENNTNFESLIKNLENHPDLYHLVEKIILEGERIGFNPDNPTIQKGILYGVFKRNGRIRIHNRVYQQRIYNYLASKIETAHSAGHYNYSGQFYLPNHELDVARILTKFQQFIGEEHHQKDNKFLEREWRLIFLAFIRPIINGKGYTFKEVQISEEKRLDVIITFYQHRYLIELKRWYGEEAHQRGIEQLRDYLERQNLQKGYLVIFDERRNKTQETKLIEIKDKEIMAIWI